MQSIGLSFEGTDTEMRYGMKPKTEYLILSIFVVSIWTTFCSNVYCQEGIELWPSIEPFESGYLEVSNIHKIYYELCGNPKGKPVFVLHGGPGGECTPGMRRFFNPEKFLIVLHDQRGCGKSVPKSEIRQNTTQNLVNDIEKLRTYLRLKKIVLFGGSWGSTLALAYAETYPENVGGLVLRGIFTATEEEIEHYYHGGVAKFFPDVYYGLLRTLPDSSSRPLPNYLFHLIEESDSAAQLVYSRAWSRYEARIGGLEVTDEFLDKLRAVLPDFAKRIHTLALLENYYMANKCFLEKDQILRDVDKIREIPTILVNGRYDMICPPISAYRLHLRLPKSKLIIVEKAGHSTGEKPIENALLEAMKQFEY
jgi:proline iminopeptidase